MTREISSRSSTNWPIWRTWWSTTSRAQHRSGSSEPRCFMILTALRIGAKGLRSSWPSMARNSFLRTSASASLRASASLLSKGFLRPLPLGDLPLNNLRHRVVTGDRASSGSKVSAAAQHAIAASKDIATTRLTGIATIAVANCENPQTTRNTPSVPTLPREGTIARTPLPNIRPDDEREDAQASQTQQSIGRLLQVDQAGGPHAPKPGRSQARITEQKNLSVQEHRLPCRGSSRDVGIVLSAALPRRHTTLTMCQTLHILPRSRDLKPQPSPVWCN